VNLPDLLITHIEQRCGADLIEVAAVGGGCISDTARVRLGSGDVVFLKWSGEHPFALFQEEARSLKALAATQTVRVPDVIHQHAQGGYAWLILEWLEPGSRSPRSQSLIGEQLAALHRHTAQKFGWEADNFIGSLHQSNRQHDRWPDFWREERLLPQLRLAARTFKPAEWQRLEQIATSCADLLATIEDEPPSLLHGDLWSGNLHVMADGTPAVIDPSSYFGHREVDLAMSRLFGGFTNDFYEAYEREWPCRPGVEKRLLLYQLYYLLVHVNLFGGGYTSQTMSVAAQLGF
jgi:protein-ribulosamine 3-kinase